MSLVFCYYKQHFRNGLICQSFDTCLRMSVAMGLLSQWNVQGIILTYVTKLYFIEVPPTFAPPAVDDSLSHCFCPFRPNVNFRNHEVGSKEWACRLWHTRDMSCDSFLGSGLPGCSPQGISLTEKDSYSGTGNCIPVALIYEQTAVVLRVRSEWHSE